MPGANHGKHVLLPSLPSFSLPCHPASFLEQQLIKIVPSFKLKESLFTRWQPLRDSSIPPMYSDHWICPKNWEGNDKHEQAKSLSWSFLFKGRMVLNHTHTWIKRSNYYGECRIDLEGVVGSVIKKMLELHTSRFRVPGCEPGPVSDSSIMLVHHAGRQQALTEGLQSWELLVLSCPSSSCCVSICGVDQ